MEGSLNRYTCDSCDGFIITMDADDGTTPFMLGCKATVGCPGRMVSSCYRGVSGTPTFVWRKPTPGEYKNSTRHMRDHFDKGGLDMHPVKSSPDPNPPRDGGG